MTMPESFSSPPIAIEMARTGRTSRRMGLAKPRSQAHILSCRTEAAK